MAASLPTFLARKPIPASYRDLDRQRPEQLIHRIGFLFVDRLWARPIHAVFSGPAAAVA